MRRYEKYKDSGIEWIGEIPKHWESIRLKYIGYLYGGLAGKSANDFNQESNFNNKPFIPFTNICNNKVIDPNQLQYVVIEEGEQQNQVAKGDLFFMMSSENFDDVGKSSILLDDLSETYLNSFCKGYRFTNEMYYPPFINYLLLSKAYRSLVLTEANGYTRINLKIDKINDIPLKTPPTLDEQVAIANYLDQKTEEIDQLIKQKEELLLLFEEEKTTLINHAVTNGINPNIKLKDSKIEWLREIPEHWGIKKIKYISSCFKGFAFKSTDFADSGIPIVKASNIKNKQIEKITSFIDINNQRQEFEKVRLNVGDIIVSTVGSKPEVTDSAVGQIGLINEEFSGSYLNQNTLCIRPLTIIDDDYLKFVFISKSIRSKFDTESSWIANQAYLEVENILDIYVPFPPITEQLIIAKSITESLERINKIVLEMNRLILLLKEFKTALISEVATGKIKVN